MVSTNRSSFTTSTPVQSRTEVNTGADQPQGANGQQNRRVHFSSDTDRSLSVLYFQVPGHTKVDVPADWKMDSANFSVYKLMKNAMSKKMKCDLRLDHFKRLETENLKLQDISLPEVPSYFRGHPDIVKKYPD